MERVLIVEDDDASRELLTQLLEDEFEVISAVDGAAGVFAAIDHQPVAILLDLGMPRLGGWNVIEMLQNDERTAEIPIVIVTGHSEHELRERAEEVGCVGFFTKPFDPEELLTMIRAVATRGQ